MNDCTRGTDDQPVAGSVHQLDGGDTLEIEHPARWNAPGYERVAWRIRNGVPIVMVHFYTTSNAGAPGMAVVCDIEVREAYRGAQLGLDTLRALGSLAGTPLRTSGSYTPSGYAALGDQLETTCPEYVEPHVAYDDMPFVDDWDTCTRIH
jgi:hypothetical protein